MNPIPPELILFLLAAMSYWRIILTSTLLPAPQEALRTAAQAGNLVSVNALLRTGVDKNTTDGVSDKSACIQSLCRNGVSVESLIDECYNSFEERFEFMLLRLLAVKQISS